MRIQSFKALLLVAASGLATSGLVALPAHAESLVITSPDGRNTVRFEPSGAGLPTYSVARDGVTFITPSAIGLRTDVQGFGAKGFTLSHTESRTVRDSYKIVVGKAASAPDAYSESTLTFTENDAGRQIRLIVRAYDDGVALRYVVPNQADFQTFGVYGEATTFAFAADYDCWGLNLGRWHSAHEGEFDKISASQIRPHNLFDSPLVCKTGEGETTFAIAESDVEHYPTAFYTRKGDNGLGVEVRLPPRLDSDLIRPYVAKISQSGTEFKTPWRVIMVGDSPRDLVESNLIATLGAPSRVADTSWIKPGKSAWDWWNGFRAPVTNPGINTETYIAYIDFAAEMGLENILIDEGWYVGSTTRPHKGSDVVTPIAAVDMPAILSHAKKKNVRVHVWLQWQQLDWQMEEAFATYEKWGIAGVKIDFMDRSDQDMVDYYHKVLSMAAKHKLLVNLHGAYAPNGLVRTYPNYITQEGVLGAEYNKWTTRITATHNVTLPYTRMIVGPIDYTPGGFDNRTPETFEILINSPATMTTRGHGLAMYVVYDSPLAMVSDAPQAYKKTDAQGNRVWQSGVDFLQQVPTSWDETRVLMGDIGEYIVTARRKGDHWYIGAMTNEARRTLDIPLSFLPESAGSYEIVTWQDGAKPDEVVKGSHTSARSGSLRLTLSPSGGGVARIVPFR